MAKKVLIDFVEGGELRRGFLGVELDSVDSKGGAVIVKVIPRSSASQAGLRENDVILSVGGKAQFCQPNKGGNLRLRLALKFPF